MLRSQGLLRSGSLLFFLPKTENRQTSFSPLILNFSLEDIGRKVGVMDGHAAWKGKVFTDGTLVYADNLRSLAEMLV